MKKLFIIIVSFLALVLLTSCEKETSSETGRITFYTTEKNEWTLYVNGVNKGKIKNTIQMPVCGDPVFLTMTLPVGHHEYILKSQYASTVRTFYVGPGCKALNCKP